MIANTAISAAIPPMVPIFLADHLAEALAVATHREEQHHHVLYGAGEDDADDDPDRARQVTHLRGQNRTDEGTSPSNGCEVVPEQHAPVGHVEVVAVLEAFGRRGTGVVDPEHPVGDEAGVEPVCDGVRRERGEEDPQGGDTLAPEQGQRRPADRADNGDGPPSHH